MRNITKILAVLFGVLFFAALYFSILTIISLSQAAETGEGDLHSSQDAPEHHVAVFLPDNSYTFFQDIIEGARQAAAEERCGLSFHPIGNGSLDFEMALYSGIDGTVIYPSIDEEEAKKALKKFNEAGIPAVLIEHTLADKSPWPFVGTNNFDFGKKIGELAAEEDREKLSIALVYSEKSPGILAEKELVEMGIHTALGKQAEVQGQSREVSLTTMKTDLNPLDAENLTYQILRERPEINTIVFTDTNDTLAAAQVLIDMNLVGTVQILGFGTDEPILEYIENGIFAGTIAVNPFRIGYDAVHVIKGLMVDGHSPGYVDTGVDIINSENLDEYRNERRERVEGQT